jgi:hypothetical protein
MLLAQDLLDEMADMPDAPEVVLVNRQVVPDIIRYMPWKLERSRPYYDRIWMFFDSETVEEVGEGIFDFLKDQLFYLEEDDDAQVLSTPKEMLERGECDCKGYALFIGGVVDAINRNSGRPEIPWCFRFVPSKILGTKIGHVFVVLDPGGNEVWVDPVLGSFNDKPFYMVQKDRYVQEEPATRVGALAVAGDGRIGEMEGVINYDPITYAATPVAGSTSPGPFPEGTVSVYGTATWIPDGYPLLTQPWLTTDGRLVLRPYQAPPPGGNFNVFVAYVMAALQVAVNEYAPTPYNVNFSTSKMSGYATVQASLYPAANIFARAARGIAFSADPNWLDLPQAPSGTLVDILSVVKQLTGGEVAGWLNEIVPGLGTLVQQKLEGNNSAATQAATDAVTATVQSMENNIIDAPPAAPVTWQSKMEQVFKDPRAWVLTAIAALGIGMLIFDDE